MSQEPQTEQSGTQSSSIIRQLQENKPSIEKSREVIIDRNGQKMVRVTKKRRVMMTEQDQQKKTRGGIKKTCIGAALLLIIAIAGTFIFFLMRASNMNSPAYLADKQAELSKAWGADVKIDGLTIENFKLQIRSISATFPANSPIEKIELSDLKSDIGLRSYINGVMDGDVMTIGRAHITLRQNLNNTRMPAFTGEDMWAFRRVVCNDFSVGFSGSNAPFTINTRAYLYKSSPSLHALYLGKDSGERSEITLRGWDKPITDMKGSFQISQKGIVHMHLDGNMGTQGSITIDGDALTNFPEGNLTFVSNEIPLSQLLGRQMKGFLDASSRKDPADIEKNEIKARIKLPLGDRTRPEISGTVALKDIHLTGLPALAQTLRYLPQDKALGYLTPQFSRGTITLTHLDDNGLKLDITDMEEVALMKIRGSVTIGKNDALSGDLSLGYPSRITSQKYNDRLPDPIFEDDRRNTSWLNLKLRGTSAQPDDNSAELDAQAVPLRKTRDLRAATDAILPPVKETGAEEPEHDAVPTIPTLDDNKPNDPDKSIFLETLQGN